jgi:hypothetical protein
LRRNQAPLPESSGSRERQLRSVFEAFCPPIGQMFLNVLHAAPMSATGRTLTPPDASINH